MGIGKTIQSFDIANVSAGCNYSNDINEITKDQSPDSMNIEFFNGRIRKRKGNIAINKQSAAYDAAIAYDAPIHYDYGIVGSAPVGYSLVDFSNTSGYHQQVVHFNSNVYAYDRLQDSKITLRSDAPLTKSFNAKVRAWLIQTYNDYSAPYYWDGAAASMTRLTNAPAFKRAIEFQGYLMGMNTSLNKMRIYYQSTSDLLGMITPYTDYFTLTPGPNDDELSDPFLLNGRLYVGTKYSIFRVSFVGGVTVFEFKQVISNIGIVPNTAQAVITKEFGQVILFLGTDKRVYLFDGANVKAISDLFYYHNPKTPIALDLIDDNYKENSFAVYDFTKRIYRLFITKKASTQNYYCMNIDVDTFAYYPFDNMEFASGDMCYDTLLRPFLVCADYQGQLRKMFIEANTDYGDPIIEYYTSPMASVKDQYLKQMTDMLIHQRPTSSAHLILSDRVDYRSAWQRRQLVPCADGRDRFLGQNFVLGSAKLGSEKEAIHPRISINVTFNHFQFRLESDTPTARAWEIYDMSVNQTVLVYGESDAQR